MRLYFPGLSIAAKAIANKIPGKDINKLITNETAWSNLPPRKPEIVPMRTPKVQEIILTTIIISVEFLNPSINLIKIDLP